MKIKPNGIYIDAHGLLWILRDYTKVFSLVYKDSEECAYLDCLSGLYAPISVHKNYFFENFQEFNSVQYLEAQYSLPDHIKTVP